MSVGLGLFATGVLALATGVSALSTRNVNDYQYDSTPVRTSINRYGDIPYYNRNTQDGISFVWSFYEFVPAGVNKTLDIRYFYSGNPNHFYYSIGNSTTWSAVPVSDTFDITYDFLGDSFLSTGTSFYDNQIVVNNDYGNNYNYLRCFFDNNGRAILEDTFVDTQSGRDTYTNLSNIFYNCDFVIFKSLGGFYLSSAYTFNNYLSYIQGNPRKNFDTDYTLTYSLMSKANTQFSNMVVNDLGVQDYLSIYSTQLYLFNDAILNTPTNVGLYGDNEYGSFTFSNGLQNVRTLITDEEKNNFYKYKFSQITNSFSVSPSNCYLGSNIPVNLTSADMGLSAINYSIKSFSSNSICFINYAFKSVADDTTYGFKGNEYELITIYNQHNEDFTRGYGLGYNDGYNTGNADGYRNGYANGYNKGVEDTAQSNNLFFNLFGSIADTPILMLRSLFNFDLFGVNVLTAVLSLITAIIVVFVIRKFI